ncbi:hypothetical protein DFJ63DRAFT_35847 [Scheffersomyces coipomensis]|uniref:uncharacterized protein n=1 Tax=Scheffersomyces coipomensis TaxID=1788519 RepID=UPI00315CF8F6
MPSNNHSYQAVSSAASGGVLPSFPPNYEDSESHLASEVGNSSTPAIEQFEIEDDYIEGGIEETPKGFLKRASLITKNFAYNFNNKIIHPVTRIIDPIYEGYKFLQVKYEQSLLKLGNPLVVKRLLYVFFIMSFIYLMTKYNDNDSINGASGGTFTTGKFYDIDKLGLSIRDFIDPKSMEENVEYFSSMPHLAGSMGDLTLAKYIEAYMTNNGMKVIDFNELQSNLNYPVFNEKSTYVKLSDDSFKATLNEFSNQNMEFLSFNPNALNTNEPIEATYIYGNYGSDDDFQKLMDNHINLKDCILLLNYGGSTPESNKVRIAQQLQVKAIIFISPQFEHDINGQKITYDDFILKENVGLTRMSPGDVLTPGWSSEDGYVTRLPWFRSDTTPKIPTIPISHKDGHQFLIKLQDKGFKFDDGHFSGTSQDDTNNSPKIKLEIQNEQRPTHQLWNVVGSIQGREQAEKGIIIGAARDSLCYGTISSNTGSAILIELVKVFASLQRKYNWTPARSIYFVSFDATEYNFAGSAEWIENRKDYIKKQGYAYIDLSDAVSGDLLSIKSHPFFHKLIKKTLKKIQTDDPNNKVDLYELYKQQHNGKDDISNNLIEQKNYIPFINLVNVPALEIKFTGKKYPKNSCYDNFENFKAMEIDPTMTKHKHILEIISLLTLELAESPLIPYDFMGLADSITKYQSDLERYFNDIVKKMNKPNVPQMHYDAITRANNALKTTARRYEEWTKSWEQYILESTGIEPSLLAMDRWKWNDNMVEFNQQFIEKDVKPRRPGYLNMLFGVPYAAPEVDDGKYEWNTFPSVRDYGYEGDFGRAQHEIDHISSILMNAADRYIEL